MPERFVSLDLGCQPCPSGSAELVLQDHKQCFVLFLAIDTQLSEEGFLEDKGVALVECVGFCQSRHGYPNDEGRRGYPHLRSAGDDPGHGLGEVLESAWLDELEDELERSAERLWAAELFRNRPHSTGLRHFVFEFKESTFEVLADDLAVSLHPYPFQKSFEEIAKIAWDRLFDD